MSEEKEWFDLETKLRALLKGEHSSLTLSFNDETATNYMTVADFIDDERFQTDWVSEAEKARAVETNSIWTLQWYPDTPIGSYSVSASSLLGLLEHVFEDP